MGAPLRPMIPNIATHIPHLIPVMVFYFSGVKNERDKRY